MKMAIIALALTMVYNCKAGECGPSGYEGFTFLQRHKCACDNVAQLTLACAAHDICYDNCDGKSVRKKCDDKFLELMKEECKVCRYPKDCSNKTSSYWKRSANASADTCISWAKRYYLVVRKWGGKFFSEKPGLECQYSATTQLSIGGDYNYGD